jgi:thiol-disulfide isomerase/thioredoxin
MRSSEPRERPIISSVRVGRRVFAGAAALGAASLAGIDGVLAGPPSRAAWLGVELAAGEGGVLAKRVVRSSPADKAGLKGGDLLLAIGAKTLAAVRDVTRAVAVAAPGDKLAFKLRRGKTDLAIAVTLGEYPGEEAVLKLDKVGTFAPAFKGGVAANGNVTDVKSLKGRVALIDFWASWCGACREATPAMNDLHDRFGAQGLTIVGLTEDPQAAALKAIGKLGIKYAVLAETASDTVGDYGVRSLPTFFVLDKKGVIREALVGLQPVEAFDKVITKLLKEPAPA